MENGQTVPTDGTAEQTSKHPSCWPWLRRRLCSSPTGMKRLLIEKKPDDDGSGYRPTLAGHVVISASILLGSGLLYVGSYGIIEDKSYQWNVCLGARPEEGRSIPPPRGIKASIHDSINSISIPTAAGAVGAAAQVQAASQPALKPVTEVQKKRLKEQVQSIESSLQASCQAAIFYFANRNATLTVSTAAGIVAIASLGFISKQGWDKSNNAVINAGITSGLVLFTLWTYGQLYSQSRNLDGLTTKYITAGNLLNTIATSLANSRDQAAEPPGLDLSTEADMARFLRALDAKLESIEKPEFLLDDSFARQSAERFNRLLNTEPPPASPAPR